MMMRQCRWDDDGICTKPGIGHYEDFCVQVCIYRRPRLDAETAVAGKKWEKEALERAEIDREMAELGACRRCQWRTADAVCVLPTCMRREHL